MDMDRSGEAANPVEKLAEGIPLLKLEHMTGITRNTLKRRIKHPTTASLYEFKQIADALDADAAALFDEVTKDGAR